MNRVTLLFCVAIFILSQNYAQDKNMQNVNININTTECHAIVTGSSGFNVRIGDKVWSYKHPDFIKAVNELRPGWLRYWSGTAGDAFSAATGMYDKEYINMFDKGEAYDRLYQFVEIKGPHRIIDLYHLLGTVNSKLVVTVNAFTETPEMTLELARFCKNNNIIVEVWQFCNEPYFYIPGRQRYWWNDGYDYAQKMKPHADAIQQIFPDAKLALNFTWDGIWGFMKEINRYQKEKGSFWNIFSKHSYAPHTGKDESFDEAYRRMNTKIIEATDSKAMNEIEQWTEKDIPMLITEFGVWNRPLNGILSAAYNAEYTLRQLSHPNTWLIGSHEISNKIRPAKNLNKQIVDAFEANQVINTNALATGLDWDDEGTALSLVHEATNNSNFVWQTTLTDPPLVAGMNNKMVEGMYALAFKGINGFDYLVITNRSNNQQTANLFYNGKAIKEEILSKWMAADQPNAKNVAIKQNVLKNVSTIAIPANSIILLKWKNNRPLLPQQSRIYNASVLPNGIYLQWWKQSSATSYVITATDKLNGNNIIRSVQKAPTNDYLFTGLEIGRDYDFVIQTKNKFGISKKSEIISISFKKPEKPSIYKTAPRDNQITVFWQSVAGSIGYKVIVASGSAALSSVYDADNVFGFKIKELDFDKPYTITVKAYNGIGESDASEPVVVTCKKNIPLPPSNISAIENDDGAIVLKWNEPKQVVPNIQYRLFRGVMPHQFSLLKEGISATDYTDVTVEKGKEYFYTVKSYTADGECSFYPNIATVVRNTKKTTVVVESITRLTDAYEVIVKYNNLSVSGESEFSVLISDVSYLNGEEIRFIAKNISDGIFVVSIPFSKLNSNAIYSIKASVKINEDIHVTSLPPHKEFKK
jgi:hypothetical protein